MDIQHEPRHREGRVFYAITEDDHLVHFDNFTLKELTEAAERHWESVYWCCQYPNGTMQELIYVGGKGLGHSE